MLYKKIYTYWNKMYFVLNQTNAGYKTSKRLFTTELCFYEGRIDLIIKPNKEITLKSHPVIKNTRLGRLTKSNHCTEQRLSAIFERVNSWISFVCLFVALSVDICITILWVHLLNWARCSSLLEPGHTSAPGWSLQTHWTGHPIPTQLPFSCFILTFR